MSWTLLANDDGQHSPALVPFARALMARRQVRVAVPDRERSWVGKAITRYEPITVARVELGGIDAWTTDGYPADTVQIGIHAIADEPPSLVVSGINLGYNHGAGFLMSSGTVGAAVEGWVSGIDAIAFSTGTTGEWATWREWVETAEAVPHWERIAELCAALTDEIAASGILEIADVVNVNVPFHATGSTERRLTSIARTGYDQLFRADGDPDTFVHTYSGMIAFDAMEGTDVDAAHDDVVSITPIRLPEAAPVPDTVRSALERQA